MNITLPGTLIVLLSGLLISGCQVLPTPAKVTLYALPASPSTAEADVSGKAPHQAHSGKSLQLTIPGSSDALAGNRLMVKDSHHGLTAYAGVRWESSVPHLWHDYLHQKLLADPGFPVVSTASESLVTDWVLMGTLRDFQLETGKGTEQVAIRYNAIVVSSKTREHIASYTFSAEEPVVGTEPAEVIEGFGRAADQVSNDLLNWLITLPSK